MDQGIERLSNARSRMLLLCGKLSVLFTVLLVLFCLFALLFLIVSLWPNSSVSSLSFSNSATWLELVSVILSLGTTGATIFVIRSVLADISKGQSPFTNAHARQIQVIGWIFVMDVLIGLTLSPGFTAVFHMNLVDVGYVAENAFSYPVIPVDLRGIGSAIICFVLSVVCRYGSLLQRESDSLV